MSTSEDKLSSSLLLKVLAFIFTGLVAVAVWVTKTSIEKLEKLNDSQIKSTTLLETYAEQNSRIESLVRDIRIDVDQLKLSDRSQQERLDALQGRK